MPTRVIAGSCARALSGQPTAAAPPSSLTKSRRCMSDPKLCRRHLRGKNDYFDRVKTGESLVVWHGPMSQLGQKRRTDGAPATSGLTRLTDVARSARLVRFVPR